MRREALTTERPAAGSSERRGERGRTGEAAPERGGALRDALTASRLTPHASPAVRRLGLADYEPTLRAMQDFTAQRDAPTPDELWLLEHPPVYTLGVASRPEHLPRITNDIPVIKTDRGGQITYHGPGQLIVYLLLDMRRPNWTVRELVGSMEHAVIELLADYGIDAAGKTGAPGVYVDDAKVAALGLRIKRGCCYHGLALNVDMDLAPFRAIDPCGYPGLEVSQLRDLGITDGIDAIGKRLIESVTKQLNAITT